MPTLEALQARLASLKVPRQITRTPEIKELPTLLGDGEDVGRIARGLYDGGVGVLVATDKRLIFVDKRWFSLRVEDFPYERVSSVQYEGGLLLGKVTIHSSGNSAEISNVDKTLASDLCSFVRGRLSAGAGGDGERATVDTTIDSLAKLKRLKDEGVIDDAQYETMRHRVLEEG